jgi:hypothetical protein
MPKLRIEKRERAIGMLQAGARVSNVARQIRCAESTIRRLYRQFQATGTFFYFYIFFYFCGFVNINVILSHKKHVKLRNNTKSKQLIETLLII